MTTARLRLLPLDAAALDAVMAGERRIGVAGVAVQVPAGWVDQDGTRPVLELFRDRAARRPDAVPWLLRAAVDASGAMVGHVGFHLPPAPVEVALADPTYVGERAPAEGGVVELGYTIFAAHRRRGLGGEAAAGLVDWAFAVGVGAVLTAVDPANVASQRVLARVGGFRVVGRAVDDDGGEEVVLRRDRP